MTARSTTHVSGHSGMPNTEISELIIITNIDCSGV